VTRIMYQDYSPVAIVCREPKQLSYATATAEYYPGISVYDELLASSAGHVTYCRHIPRTAYEADR